MNKLNFLTNFSLIRLKHPLIAYIAIFAYSNLLLFPINNALASTPMEKDIEIFRGRSTTDQKEIVSNELRYTEEKLAEIASTFKPNASAPHQSRLELAPFQTKLLKLELLIPKEQKDLIGDVVDMRKRVRTVMDVLREDFKRPAFKSSLVDEVKEGVCGMLWDAFRQTQNMLLQDPFTLCSYLLFQNRIAQMGKNVSAVLNNPVVQGLSIFSMFTMGRAAMTATNLFTEYTYTEGQVLDLTKNCIQISNAQNGWVKVSVDTDPTACNLTDYASTSTVVAVYSFANPPLSTLNTLTLTGPMTEVNIHLCSLKCAFTPTFCANTGIGGVIYDNVTGLLINTLFRCNRVYIKPQILSGDLGSFGPYAQVPLSLLKLTYTSPNNVSASESILAGRSDIGFWANLAAPNIPSNGTLADVAQGAFIYNCNGSTRPSYNQLLLCNRINGSTFICSNWTNLTYNFVEPPTTSSGGINPAIPATLGSLGGAVATGGAGYLLLRYYNALTRANFPTGEYLYDTVGTDTPNFSWGSGRIFARCLQRILNKTGIDFDTFNIEEKQKFLEACVLPAFKSAKVYKTNEGWSLYKVTVNIEALESKDTQKKMAKAIQTNKRKTMPSVVEKYSDDTWHKVRSADIILKDGRHFSETLIGGTFDTNFKEILQDLIDWEMIQTSSKHAERHNFIDKCVIPAFTDFCKNANKTGVIVLTPQTFSFIDLLKYPENKRLIGDSIANYATKNMLVYQEQRDQLDSPTVDALVLHNNSGFNQSDTSIELQSFEQQQQDHEGYRLLVEQPRY